MDNKNEILAAAIIKIDGGALWVYSGFCRRCGRFLYHDDLKLNECVKCGEGTATAIRHPLPFLTSATAIEKLIKWLKRMTITNQNNYHVAMAMVIYYMNGWLAGSLTAEGCRTEIVDAAIRSLGSALSD